MKSFSRKQPQQLALMLLIIVGTALRVFVCFQHNPMDYIWSDPLRHWENGLHFPKGGYLGAADPIVYQAYIAFLIRTTFGNRILIALSSGLLSVLMPWTYYRAAREFGLRKVPALWVWALITWTPSLLTIYHYIMMETLLLVMEGFALWATARYLRKGGTAGFLGLVFFWTLAALTKPTVIPLAGICFLWSLWKKRPSILAVASGVALAAVLMVPQAIRSEAGLGFVAPFGNPWLTKIQHRSGARTIYLHFYNRPRQLFHHSIEGGVYELEFRSPSVFVQPLWPFSRWRIRRASGNTSIHVTVNAEHGAEDWKNTYDSLHVGWREWLAQWRENIVLFFFAPSWPETVIHEWDGSLTYFTRWMWAPLIVFLLVANIRCFRRRRFQLIPIAVTGFTLFLMLQNVVTAEGRYNQPLEPLLLLNLVWTLESDNAAEGNGQRKFVSTAMPQGPAGSNAGEVIRSARAQTLPATLGSPAAFSRHGRDVDRYKPALA